MRFLLTGVSSLRNRGVEALVQSILAGVRGHWPTATITVLSGDPRFDESRLTDQGVAVVADPFPRLAGSAAQRLRASLSRLRPGFHRDYRRAVQAARAADLVIATGGDVFSSDDPTFRAYLEPLRLAQQAGRATVFLAQSVGPFRNATDTGDWLRVARRATLITVREGISYEYLTRTLGLPAERVQQTADPAFLLPAAPAPAVRRMLASYGVDAAQPLVVAAVSQGICRYRQLDARQHLAAWCRVLRTVTQELGAQVLLVPHVQRPEPVEDDRVLATALLQALDYDPQVHLAGGDHTAMEFKGMIGASALVIAERMHAAIAGLSSGVPTLVIGYSIKGEGILRELLGAELAASAYLLAADRFLEPDQAETILRAAWAHRAEARAQLQHTVPRAQQLAAANYEQLAALRL